MRLLSKIIIVAVFFTMCVSAEPVLLKGTVKKSGGTAGIAGVTLSLVKVPEITAVSGDDGGFTLTGSTSPVTIFNPARKSVQFLIRGKNLVITPVPKTSPVNVTFFDCSGKLNASITLSDPQVQERCMPLPNLAPGFTIMQVTIGQESFTRTLVRVGNDVALESEMMVGTDDGLMFAKQSAAAVDTIRAEKDGFIVKKVPVEKYSQENIEIALDTNGGVLPGACTRESLKAIADAYIEAQKAGDPAKLPLASTVKYVQNNKTITADKCICKTAMPIDNSITFLDVDSCRAFVEIISSTGTTPWVLIAWLKVDAGKITTIDAMVTTKGDFQFDAKKYLSYTKNQDWSILTKEQQVSRQKLINGANAYLNMFKAGVDSVPWGTPCARVEGGNMYISPDCIAGMPGHGGSGTVDINNRRYTVDVDMGTVDVFCSFAGSMPDSHMFRLIDGKIRLVHTLSVQNK